MSAVPPPPSQAETIEALLEATKRSFLPIRRAFVQQRKGKGYVGGPLSKFVANQDEHGLDQYLLVHAKASGGDGTVTLGALVWARALGRDANDRPHRRVEGMEAHRRTQPHQSVAQRP